MPPVRSGSRTGIAIDRPLPDGDALLHASPIAAHMIGLAVARDAIGFAPLAKGDAAALIARVAPILQRSGDGGVDAADGAS